MFRRFLKSEDGIALVYFLVALPAFFALAVLIIDIGRGDNLHLDLQNAADGLALAAAAELDAGPNAISRANNAIANLVNNQARFGDTNPQGFIVNDNPTELTVYYLDAIPASDNTLIDAAWVANHTGTDYTARFAAVYIKPVNYSLLFPLDFFSQTTVPVAAHAVAGFRAVVCKFTPFYICNPYGSYQALEQAVADDASRRRLYELRQAPSDPTGAAAGQYGFLNSPDANGADAIRDMLASNNQKTCFSQRGVTLQHGQLGAAASDALNVRFDVYRASMSGNKNKDGFPPATNVRKGFNPGGPPDNCPDNNTNPPVPPGLGKMPRDTCFTDGDCPLLGGHGGDGYWKCLTYWNNNHSGHAAPPGCVDAETLTLPSRYNVYKYENDPSRPWGVTDAASGNSETGTPKCYKKQASSPPDAKRRLVYAAILQCPVTVEPAPVVAYASFFLSEPADYGANSSIWGEFVDITGRFGEGTLKTFNRDDVQLYR